jgi:predicted acetyltransferase
VACGFARAWPLRQFYGGRAVPVAGLASVAVDPHARGGGVASTLLRAVLPALRERGQPLSVLYPSVLPLYRAHGWEQAGVREAVDIPLLALRAARLSPPADVRLRPLVEADLPAVRACYLALTDGIDGLLDRSRPPFDFAHLPTADLATVVEGTDGLRGYLAASRAGDPRLDVHELVALDADAELALLASVASWSGQLTDVRLPVLHPRSLLPATLGATLLSEQWMLRVVDLPAAVAARGWPRAAWLRDLTVDLDVTDEHAPWNAGNWRLTCADGAVTATRGGSGAVRVTARGLAAWYAGSAPAAALRRAGLLDGDPATGLDALTGVAGPPRLLEPF